MSPHTARRVIVIGADAAGMSGASQVKRRQPSWTVRAFDRSPFALFSL
jgi:predicted flavoprotein YhiN